MKGIYILKKIAKEGLVKLKGGVRTPPPPPPSVSIVDCDLELNLDSGPAGAHVNGARPLDH